MKLGLTQFINREPLTWIECSNLDEMVKLYNAFNKANYHNYIEGKWDVGFKESYFVYGAKYYANNKGHDIYTRYVSDDDEIININNIVLDK